VNLARFDGLDPKGRIGLAPCNPRLFPSVAAAAAIPSSGPPCTPAPPHPRPLRPRVRQDLSAQSSIPSTVPCDLFLTRVESIDLLICSTSTTPSQPRSWGRTLRGRVGIVTDLGRTLLLVWQVVYRGVSHIQPLIPLRFRVSGTGTCSLFL